MQPFSKRHICKTPDDHYFPSILLVHSEKLLPVGTHHFPLKIFPEEFNFFENFHGRISCEILQILNHVSEAATGGVL